MNINWKEIEEKLRTTLNDARLRHTIGVSYTAAAIAMAHGFDVEKARLAGLLHDCAKYIPSSERIRLCKDHGIPVTECERKNSSLLHSKLGVLLAKEEYGIEEEDILGAIRWHTTGKPDMTILEQIIYIADYIEPNRDDEITIDPQIRISAFKDLDLCCEQVMDASIRYLRITGKSMDKMTTEAFNYYHEKNKNRI